MKHPYSLPATLLMVFVVSAAALGTLLILRFWADVPTGDLTRDPISVAGVSSYVGFLSQVGIFFWSASAAICLFAACLLRIRARNSPLGEFIFVSGLLSLMLGVDDAFLLHERFFPHIGIPENAVYAGYAVLVLLWLARYRTTIWNPGCAVLGISFLLFGASILSDIFHPEIPDIYLFEDGVKFIGIVTWLAYFLRVCIGALCADAARPGFEPGCLGRGFETRR